MKMKRKIFNAWQTGGLRLAVCTLVLGLSTAVCAQADDEELEEVETAIKQPKRSQEKQRIYPMMRLNGMVTDQATGRPY